MFYVKGGGHYSVAIDQRDHIAVVEAPLNEERSLAVIAVVKEMAWGGLHTLNPDRLAQSRKAAVFETVAGKLVLTNGTRPIEIHTIAGNGHNDAFVMIARPARASSSKWMRGSRLRRTRRRPSKQAAVGAATATR